MVLTTIASNCQLKMSDDLRLSLPASWAFVDRYGQQVLDLVAKLDTDDRGRREAKKVVDQTARKQENEGKALDRAAKENLNIPGTGCFSTQDLLSKVDHKSSAPENM
ncbi:hypothetical protein V8E55_004608 [Tylopilus felleus]